MKTGAGWLAFERCGVAQRAFLILMVVFGFSAWGQTNANYWTNATTGKWESSNSWSAGAPPNVSQAAIVSQFPINANVTIDSTTAQLAPQSLTVGGIELLPGNTLVFSNSVNGLPLQATNQLSMPAGGLFDQQVGTAIFPFFDFGGGSCHLRTGNMFFGTVQIAQQTGGGAQFVQDAGTNHIGALNMGIGGSEYDLNGGVLFTGSTIVMAYREAGAFQQNGGTHMVTNSLTIQGCAGHDCNGAYYILTNGTLSAQSLDIDDSGGWSTFSQKGGTTLISTSVQAIGPAVARGILALDSGFFGCSDVVNINNGITDIDQSGGVFVVSNVLHFAGYTPGEQSPGLFIKPGFADFNFSGGTLWANNIEMSANFNIGSSTEAGRISNPGYFKLAGTINISDANEQLGTLILATDTATNIQTQSPIVISDSLINFAGSNAVLAFARSDSQTWSNAALLVVSNWNGSTNGDGTEQLIFGSNASGLTVAQVGQIRFVNPVGFAPGTYAAKILATGEVVASAPTVSERLVGNGLVMSWPDSSYALQFATNVLGPWTNVANATSPYTNNFANFPQEFFRLQR